jgi:FkbM family methyltransferase
MEALVRKACIALAPRSWLLKRTLSNGAVVYGQNSPGYGGRAIFLEGDRIEPELQHLERLLDPGAVFMDIGANTGVFALKAAKHLQGGGTVIAVEPGLDMLKTLAYSVEANGFTNVRLRNFCLGERTGEQTLWLNYNKPNAFSLLKRSDGAGSVSVLVVALDDLCAWEHLTRLDYLKIDVVGAEQKVLAGGLEAIRRFRPIVQVAITAGYFPVDLPDYSVYRMLNAPKANVVHIANGDARAGRFLELGWQKTPA